MRALLTAPPIVRNARRLLANADLLAENGRCASAFVLATLALEEVGKVVLVFWGSDPTLKDALKGSSLHVQKQSAAAALLLADLIGSSSVTLRVRVLTREMPSGRGMKHGGGCIY